MFRDLSYWSEYRIQRERKKKLDKPNQPAMALMVSSSAAQLKSESSSMIHLNLNCSSATIECTIRYNSIGKHKDEQKRNQSRVFLY